jgi:hypothetical protein
VSRALERRLIAAERRLNPPVPAGGEFVIIREIITPGGLPGSDDDPTFATAGEMRWERAPAETLAAFRARAVAAATAAGERRIVIGGRSDNDPLDDAPPESCNGDRPRAAAAVAEAAQDGREHDARSWGRSSGFAPAPPTHCREPDHVIAAPLQGEVHTAKGCR